MRAGVRGICRQIAGLTVDRLMLCAENKICAMLTHRLVSSGAAHTHHMILNKSSLIAFSDTIFEHWTYLYILVLHQNKQTNRQTEVIFEQVYSKALILSSSELQA